MGDFSLPSGYTPAPLNPEIIFEGVNPLCHCFASSKTTDKIVQRFFPIYFKEVGGKGGGGGGVDRLQPI